MQESAAEQTLFPFLSGSPMKKKGAVEAIAIEVPDDHSPVPDGRKNRNKKLLVYTMLLVLLALTVSLSGIYLVYNYRHSGKIKSMLTISGLTDNPFEPPVSKPLSDTSDSLQRSTGRENQPAFPPRYAEENISHPPGVREAINDGSQPVMYHPGQETGLPSIVSFRQDEKNIRLIMLQQEVLALQVDSRIIEPDSFPNFQAFIETGKSLAHHSATPPQNESSTAELQREELRQREVFRNTMMKALARDGLIREGQAQQVHLLWNNLFVDGLSQSRELFEKYKALYEETTGHRLNRQSDIRITN